MNKKRIIVSALIGTIALSALSLSISLAWYASSSRLQVESIDISIKGDAHLLVSTSEERDSFKESLTKEDLNAVDKFIPVSSMHKNTWMEEKKEFPVFYDTSSPVVPSSGIPNLTVADYGYFQQKLYFLSDVNYYVTLSGTESLFDVDEESNFLRAQELHKSVPSLSVEEIQEKLNGLVNSLRISILVPDANHYQYYVIDPTRKEHEVTYFAGLLDNDADGYFDTYETRDANNNIIEKEVVYGEVNNRESVKYDDPKGGQLIPNPNFDPTENRFFGNSFNGKSKETAYTFNESASSSNGVTFAKEESISLVDLESPANPVLIPCYRNEVREIVVSIYLEGWDLDCYNSTMGASFISTLSFKLLGGII